LAPVPVSSVKADARFALLGVAKKVATPVPKPETPVEIGSPVALVRVADVGVPSTGVTRVGLVANTAAPEPVSSVRVEARLALDGVARNVATPVPRPATPVEIGKPVALVSVAEVGVPNTGVTNVGEVERTVLPEPVEEVTPVPPLATGNVPVTPVVSGNPVALVRTPDAGVPNAGVVSVGAVKVLLVKVCVLVVPTTAPVAPCPVVASMCVLDSLKVTTNNHMSDNCTSRVGYTSRTINASSNSKCVT